MTQDMERTQRMLKGANVAATLSQAGIPALGANKLSMLSRTGNPYTREDGTAVRIFNVLAYKSEADQLESVEHWKEGMALENSGDLEGAQEHYRLAYNKLMGFSVLESNAADFEGVFEVAGIIEQVPASKALQDAGTKTVLGFNRPRPVAVKANITNSKALFVIEEEETPPATKTVSKKNTAAAGAKK